MSKGYGAQSSAHTLSVNASTCNCVGPQNGQPLCPCQMRDVQIVDGRYVQLIDLGPVPSSGGRRPMLNVEHKCPKCDTCYFEKQECDYCPGQQTS